MNSPSALLSIDNHLIDRLHEQALETANRYKHAEANLIEILQQIEEHLVHLKKGHSSLFQYVVAELGLSESVAYNLIAVSRKAREVPALAVEILKGVITLSNARKIVPVLNPQNQAMWLAKARTLSQRQLEKEIVKVRPECATPEKASYVTENRVRLERGLSENDMLRLRRIQDLISQARRRPVTLEEVLVNLSEDYLKRHDPLERAKRQKVRNGLLEKTTVQDTEKDSEKNPEKNPEEVLVKPPAEFLDKNPEKLPTESVDKPVSLPNSSTKAPANPSPKREPIPANLLHQINLRDERRCTFIKSNEARCNQTRWIEIHHKIPVSQGGGNTLENLITLCAAHHKWVHS